MTVFVRYQEDGSVTIQTPYNQAFIDDLKASIPFRHRSWRPDEKLWSVDAIYAKNAEDLCKDWYEDVHVAYFERQRQQSQNSTGTPSRPVEPWATLHLLPTAPKPLVRAVYLELMKIHHPDKGGDTAITQKINAAFDELRKHA